MSEKKAIDTKFASEVADNPQPAWRIYLQVGIIGLLIVTALWYIMSADARISNQYLPLIDASAKIKYESAVVHLRFEEFISGDQSEDIKSIWHHFSKAEWFTRVMLDGGQCEGVIYIPLKDPRLIESINGVLAEMKIFRIIAEERYANWEKSFIGSEIDQRFDSIFGNLVLKTDEVESALQIAMRRDIEDVRMVQSVLIVLCLILTGIIGTILHRFQRKQLANLSKIKASNHQLMASEQQLRAANQQLTASEQQLRAANQQLKASEQQQLAINQQLRASEQQLRAANQELSQSQQKLSLHVKHTPLAVIQWDLDFKVTEWNNAAEEIFGFTYEEAIGRHAAGLIVPESAREIVDQEWQELLQQEGGTRSTNENNSKENKIITCEWYNTPLIDDKGNTIGVASLVLDITSRELAQKELSDSEEKFRTLVESISIIPWRLDLKTTKFIFMGKQVEKILGYPAESWIDIDSWSSRIHPDDSKASLDYCLSATAKGEDHDFDYRCLSANGDIVWIRDIVTVRKDEHGQPFELVGYMVDITDRKLAEIQLVESEKVLRKVQSVARVGFLKWDLKTDRIFLSDTAIKIFELETGDNWTTSELVTRIVHPDDLENASSNLERIKRGKTPHNIDHRVVTPDGKIVWVHAQHELTHNENGQPISLLGTVIDITDLKLSQIKIIESEKALLESQEVARIGSYILDIPAGQWTSSKILDELFGLESENGRRSVDVWASIIHPEHKQEMIDYFMNEVVEKRGRFDKEYKIVRKNDQAVRWVHGMGKLELNDQGQPITMLGTIQDITERKKADEALRISEQKLRTYISSAPDAIFIVNAGGRYVEVNKAALEMTGYTESELTILSISDIVDPESRDSAMMNFEELRKTGKTSTELKLKRKDGTLCWVSLDAVTLSDDRLMAFCSDITETKRLQELESRAERLETAGTIAGQVAHDFNNLLGPLMAYPEFIRDELPKNHPALEYLDQIETAAHKIANINQDLLAMGRRGHFNQVALNLNTIVQQALSELKPYPKALICETNLNSELMDILGGGAQLHRMISNLLHNAKDAMREIGQITVRTENYYVDDVSVIYGRVPKGEYVKLTISDTGCGIPDNIIQKIFDPFFTSKTADKKRGSGLGLSVVDAVVKDHHGYLDLRSKVGQGTSFYLYFPVTRENAVGIESEELKGGTETVLVIDDDEVQRKVSSQLLSRMGYNVTTVESGELAIEALKKTGFDLLVLDMIMPGGIDGAETYKRIVEIYPLQKAIILSGFSESARVLEAQSWGAGTFVKKPVTKRDIATAVRKELDRPKR